MTGDSPDGRGGHSASRDPVGAMSGNAAFASPALGAILLAGGRASRMGGVAKPLLEIAGRSMLQRAIDACLAMGCAPVTVVGPEPGEATTALAPPDDAITTLDPAPLPSPLPRAVRWTREDPPFSGPAAAVVAALATWDLAPDWTFVLACDLPRVDAAVQQLSNDMLLLPSDTDGVCLADPSSRPQWLIGVYRTVALQRTAAALNDSGRNASMHALLDDLAIAVVEASADVTGDIDTWEDFERYRRND